MAVRPLLRIGSLLLLLLLVIVVVDIVLVVQAEKGRRFKRRHGARENRTGHRVPLRGLQQDVL